MASSESATNPATGETNGLTAPVVGILQPSYLPWLGAFDMLAVCDAWIFYDDVQYTRRDWRNRNRIKGPGGPEYLTVPVVKAPRETSIREIEVHRESGFAETHLAKLRARYAGAPHLEAVLALLADCFAREHRLLSDLCIESTTALARYLGIETKLHRASEFRATGKGAERIRALCRAVGAASYVNGAAGRDLYRAADFREIGVELVFHDYRHPEYAQPHPPFASHLSVVDLLVAHEPARALEIIRSGSNLFR